MSSRARADAPKELVEIVTRWLNDPEDPAPARLLRLQRRSRRTIDPFLCPTHAWSFLRWGEVVSLSGTGNYQ